MEELKLLIERLEKKAEQIKKDPSSDSIDLAKAIGIRRSILEAFNMINELKNKAA